MVNATQELIVNIKTIVHSSGLKQATNAISKFQQKLGLQSKVNAYKDLNIGINKAGSAFDLTTKKTISYNEVLKRQKIQLDKVKNSFTSINTIMNVLGITFGAMFAQRAFNTLFKSLIKNYRDLAAKTNPLNVALTRLEANFIFLKYAIIEAMGPFLMGIIDGLINLTDAIADMNPETLEAIGKGLLFLAIGFTALSIIGQTLMFLGSFARLLPFLSGLVGGLSRALSGLFNVVSKAAPFIAIVAFVLKFLWEVYKDFDIIVGAIKLILEGIFELDGSKVVKGITAYFATILKAFLETIRWFVDGLWNVFNTINIGDNIIKWITGENPAEKARAQFNKLFKTYTDLLGTFANYQVTSGENPNIVGGMFNSIIPLPSPAVVNATASALSGGGNSLAEAANNLSKVLSIESNGTNKQISDFLGIDTAINNLLKSSTEKTIPAYIGALTSESAAHLSNSTAVMAEAAAFDRLAESKARAGAGGSSGGGNLSSSANSGGSSAGNKEAYTIRNGNSYSIGYR